MMLTRCKGCGHDLWSEVLASGALRFVVHFDADERSVTHAQHVPSCPGCGAPLDLGISESAPQGYPTDRGGRVILRTSALAQGTQRPPAD